MAELAQRLVHARMVPQEHRRSVPGQASGSFAAQMSVAAYWDERNLPQPPAGRPASGELLHTYQTSPRVPTRASSNGNLVLGDSFARGMAL